MTIETLSPFHTGEQLIQRKLGIRDPMEQLGRRVIRDQMPDQHRRFFCQLPYVLLGHIDAQGWPWASALCNPDKSLEGFIDSPDNHSLVIPFAPLFSDPLNHGLEPQQRIGLLGIELHSRRRNRLSATVTNVSADAVEVSVDQSFGNCPKYINQRVLGKNPTDKSPRFRATTTLDARSRQIIEQADTFFVASYAGNGKRNNPGTADEQVKGVDISHRGGQPGFVKIENNVLHIPDYRGNNFFNTLGNFVLNPKAGLLFIDFNTGDVVMLSGTIRINWEAIPDLHAGNVPRSWEFTPRKILLISNAFPYLAVD